jgi:hypothetical protein
MMVQAGRQVVAPDGAPSNGAADDHGRRRVAELIAVGFRTEPFVAGQGRVAGFPHQPAREDVEDLFDAVAGGIESCGHVIAIIPAWNAEPALQRLETVKAATDGGALATYATDLPPLAGAVLSSLAGALATHVESAGMLYAGFESLERELLVYAWMKSVAGLSRPAPSLAQHAISMWPGSSFGVTLQPDPLIKRLTKADRTLPFPTSYRPMCLAVSARPGGDVDWVTDVVGPGLGSPPVKQVDPMPEGPRWWGTSRFVEAVAYPIDVPVVARRITQGLARALCNWCGELIAGERCPFCGLDRTLGRHDGGGS